MKDLEIKLTPRTAEIVGAYIQNPRLTYTELAKQFGVSLPRISQIMRSRRVLEAYPFLAKQRIKSIVPRAAQRFEELMNQTDNLQVAAKVTERILDSEKVLEPVERRIKHELELKSVDELREIISRTNVLPTRSIDVEIVEAELKDDEEDD